MPKTVSQEMAERLKAAGLMWEPKVGDCFQWITAGTMLYIQTTKEAKALNCERQNIAYLYMPTLSYLLEWLEGEGVLPAIKCFDNAGGGRWFCVLSKIDALGFRYDILGAEFNAKTPEGAVGEAVLWMLKKKNFGYLELFLAERMPGS